MSSSTHRRGAFAATALFTTLVLTAVAAPAYAGGKKVAPPPPSPPAAGSSFHVVASKTPVVDSHGRNWQPDTGFASGGTITSSTAQVSGTASPALYRDQRIGVTGYAFPVTAPGTYSVVLYLAELGGRGPGHRVYDVTAEGATVASQVDVAAVAGKNVAWHLVLTTPVTDGVLNLDVVSRVDKPVVSAVAVEFMNAELSPTVTFSDDFNSPTGTPPDTSLWNQDVMAGQNKELNMFTDHNAYTDGAGNMVITAKKEPAITPAGFPRDYTSGRLSTDHIFSYQYGRAEARILIPPGQGLWPTWWAMGADTQWPASGEIDFMEAIGQQPSTDFGTAHGITTDGLHWQYGTTTTAAGLLTGAWHDYESVWVPDAIESTVDGRAFMTVTPADLPADEIWPFDKPFWLRLDLAVGGTFAGPPSSSTVFPADMKIDWVRVTQ